MIYQQYKSAVKNAYTGRDDAADHAATAARCLEWLESLEIEAELRNSLAEPIRALEEAFRELVAPPQ